MKRLTFLPLFLLGFLANAQVPNWKLTSASDGIEYEMHQLLAQGNAVIIDFSSSWCGPCIKNAPELEAIYQAYGSGTMNVKVFDFLLQNTSFMKADSTDLYQWESQLNLSYPGFVDVDNVYLDYNSLYNGGGSIPLILVFIPNQTNPALSTLVYNFITGLGVNSNDVSDDIHAALSANGFWAIGIEEELSSNRDRKLLRITNVLGQETLPKRNTPLFYIYDDGSREKVIVTE